jgi:lipid II:glycine glycyltransferase (peptidoglycan interpeptide bridge formation enzyme)
VRLPFFARFAPEDGDWDDFVARHPQGHPEQTSEFGRLRRAYGFRPERVVVREGRTIIGGAQAIVQRTPIGKIAWVFRGPIAREDDPVVLHRVVSELDRLARRRRYASMSVETLPNQLQSRRALEHAGYHSSSRWWVDEGERPSVVANLERSDDEILAAMKPQGRRNVRTAIKSGVTVREGDATDLGTFYRLHELTADHQEFPIFPKAYFDYLWGHLAHRGRACLLLAEHEGRAVAAILNVVVGDHVYYTWGGMHRGQREQKLKANALLHFQAMTWGRDHGCKVYDLTGTSQFKAQLAREEIRWPLPQRKFYGPLARVRRLASERAWATPVVRKGIEKAAYRLRLSQRMPY